MGAVQYAFANMLILLKRRWILIKYFVQSFLEVYVKISKKEKIEKKLLF